MRFLRGRATALKFGSIVSVVVLVLVGFSTLVQPAGSGADGSPPPPEDAAENARPLVVTSDSVEEVRIGVAGEDVVHAAWIAGGKVFHKLSTDRGETFGPDRVVAEGLGAPSNLALGTLRGERAAAVVFDAERGGSRGVYYRASFDGSWGPLVFVGNGTVPRVTVRRESLFVSYLHAWGDGTHALVALRIPLRDGSRGAETLFAFNTTATQHDLLLLGTHLHAVWEERGDPPLLAHTAYDLSRSQLDGTHLVAALEAPPDPASLHLVGREDRVYAIWSEVRDYVHRLVDAYSLNGGSTWVGNQPFTGGGTNARRPAAALSTDGQMRVAWEDDRTGRWQLFGAEFNPDGPWARDARRLSDSPASVRSVEIAVDGDDATFATWVDTRGGVPGAFVDTDLFPNRGEVDSILRYARRLDSAAYRTPARASRDQFLLLLRDVRELVDTSQEAEASDSLDMKVVPRIDGSLGGDPADDLVVSAAAQAQLKRMIDRLQAFLRAGPEGTREFTGDDPPQVPWQPAPPGEDRGPFSSKAVRNLKVITLTSTTARVTWDTFPSPADATGIDYRKVDPGSSLLTVNDTATPYDVTLTGLTKNSTYVYVGRMKTSGLIFSSRPYGFYTGVQVSAVVASGSTSTTATVTWRTNTPSTTRVRFGVESAWESFQDGTSGTSHSLTVTGLTPKTWYRYLVESVGTADATMVARSAEGRFCTCVLITDPVWTDAGFSAGGLKNLKVSWKTNLATDSMVRWGNSPGQYPSSTVATGSTAPVATISGLYSNRTYYYQLRSISPTDTEDYAVHEGNLTTPAIRISKVEIHAASTSTWVNWTTDYIATGKVKYGLTAAYGSQVTGASSRSHALQITGLQSGKTYHFQIESTLSDGNYGSDTVRTLDRTFTTQGILITASSVTAGSITTTSAVISWTTGCCGNSVVRYGYGSIWEKTVSVANNVTSHAVTLTGLLPYTIYRYRAESTHWSNANDTNVSLEKKFTTLDTANDMNTSSDAGGTYQTAMLANLGAFNGTVNNAADVLDVYRYLATSPQTIKAKVQPQACCNVALALLSSTGSVLVTADAYGNGGAESFSYLFTTTPATFYVRVGWVSGTGATKTNYTLTTNLTGGAWERLSLNVGSSGVDDKLPGNLPGLHIALTGLWGAIITDTVQSYAVDPSPYFPTYRLASANASFYLNLHAASSHRYTDWQLTVQYYATQDGNLTVNNGAGWVEIGTLKAKTAWWTQTLRLDHTLLYDALPTSAGLNVEMRFSNTTKVDYIAAVPVRWTTYVGHGSDDTVPALHGPGIELHTGWVDEGQGYKNATSGATLWLNVPDPVATYQVALRFRGDLAYLRVEQQTSPTAWTTSAYVDWFSATSLFTTDRLLNYDADSTKPGLNLHLRLTGNGTIHEVTYLAANVVSLNTDVGVTGDNSFAAHEPGASVLTNGEWGNPQTELSSGITYRHGTNLANLYLNGIEASTRYLVFVTYKSGLAGTLRQWNGTSSWISLGTVPSSPTAWKTAAVPTSSAFQRDYYASPHLNLFLEFYGFGAAGLDLDRVWFEPDPDGDNITDYGETGSFAFEDTSTHSATYEIAYTFRTEGRYPWKVSLTGFGTPSATAAASVYLDGALQGSVTGTTTYSTDVNFVTRSCAVTHTLRVESTGTALVQATLIRYYKAPTDPANNDTDGDGLRDKEEACALGTDPLLQDTDADNVTDFEEAYGFSFSTSPNTVVSGTQSLLWNATVGALGFYKVSVTRDDTVPAHGTLGLSFVLDGQSRGAVNVSSSGTGRVVTFDAVLYKGLHSLQVRKSSGSSSASSTIKVASVVRDASYKTDPKLNDTDQDGLLDGDEIRGLSGWVTVPVDRDTDDDGADDGPEVQAMHSDPTLKDTDGDGYVDGIDLDPLHDLVVQARIVEFIVMGVPDGFLYLTAGGVAGNWTNSEETARGSVKYAYQNVSVDVHDDQPLVSVEFSMWGNNGAHVDLAAGSGLNAVVAFSVLGKDDMGIPPPGGVYSSCGDSGGSLWGCLNYQIRTFRVGKLNTLLLTPNDWSGVFNGSTGLHRYQGEQRFAFVLLNVTDAYGDKFHADMESFLGPTQLQDQSPAKRSLAVYGSPVAVPGWHGKALRFDGVDDNVLTLDGTGLDTPVTLQVSLFFRPDRDYVPESGSAFYGFAERAASGTDWLWRFGWDASVDGLRFDVKDTGGATHTVTAPTYGLSRGTWVHLTAFATTTWMQVRVDGQAVAYGSYGSVALKSGTQLLRIGYDPETGTYLKGTVDEVAVWSSWKTLAAIQGMATFVQGSNAIIVPRGLWYESKLNQTLDGSDPRSSNPALNKMTVQANQFAISGTLTLDAYLNARPVQMVLSGNVSLEEAQWFVDQLRLNRTGKTTAFLLDVTDEFYTVGFVGAVIALAPNATVDNSLNHTASAPPTPWWEQLFNVIVSVAAIAWNAALAVANFFVNLVKWLVNIVVGLVIGLATGDWTYFVDNVVKPFVEAMMALIKLVLDLIKAIIDTLLKPIIDAIVTFVTGVLNIIVQHTLHTNLALAAAMLGTLITGAIILHYIRITVIGFEMVEVGTKPFSALASLFTPFITGLIISAVIGAAIGIGVAALIDAVEKGDVGPFALAELGLIGSALDLALLLFTTFQELSDADDIKVLGGLDVALALGGVILSVLSDGFIKASDLSPEDKKAATIRADAAGIILNLVAVRVWFKERKDAATQAFRQAWPITSKVSDFMVFFSLGVTAGALFVDYFGT